MPFYRLPVRALRLEERKQLTESSKDPSDPEGKKTIETYTSTGWWLTLSTTPPVSIGLGPDKPELPLTLTFEVTK